MNSHVKEVQSEPGWDWEALEIGIKLKHKSKALLEPLPDYGSLDRTTTCYPVKIEWPRPGYHDIQNAGVALAHMYTVSTSCTSCILSEECLLFALSEHLGCKNKIEMCSVPVENYSLLRFSLLRIFHIFKQAPISLCQEVQFTLNHLWCF